MQPIFFIVLIGLAGGMAIGIQGPLSSVITQRLGSLESVFIIHVGGAVAALMPMMVVGSRLGEWRSVPWYALGAGALGLIVITAMGYMIPRIGAAGALITLMAGGSPVASLPGPFCWLGGGQRSVGIQRIIGFAVVMFGVWLTVK